jgi:hypothetical protein
MFQLVQTWTLIFLLFAINSKAFSPFVIQRLGSSYTNTKIYGIDFSNIQDDECDFVTTSSDFQYECLPQPGPEIIPEDVVSLCMDYLQHNREPVINAGLQVCFNFSSDSCRAANGGNLEAFMAYASNPTFRVLVNNKEWKVLSVGPEIAGTNTRGAMKTVLISVKPANERIHEKKFLWTLIKERRPPRQGFWLVHECISVDNAYSLTA